jgi:biopolymer transport protein ExbB
MFDFSREVLDIWVKGGWLMVPLFVLTLFIYYAVLELLLGLNEHFLVRSGYHSSSDEAIALALRSGHRGLSRVIALDAKGPAGARRHFKEVRAEYIPVIDRRIHFLSILITTGPLVGLLGTVTGMLTTFDGIAAGESSKFAIIVSGVSEALITTQGGLIISIPAFVLLSFIIQRRNQLEHCLSRLEQYNIRIAMRRDG